MAQDGPQARRHALMRRMGVEALYRRPNTSKRHPQRNYPSLPRGFAIERANHVWPMDLTTYIPMARGFVYMAAVIDWHSRKVLGWDVSISAEVDVLDAALARHGMPAIFDQGQPLDHRDSNQ